MGTSLVINASQELIHLKEVNSEMFQSILVFLVNFKVKNGILLLLNVIVLLEKH